MDRIMEKKDYVKPQMKSIKYRQHTFLCGSPYDGGGEGGPGGYIPGMAPEEQNKLA